MECLSVVSTLAGRGSSASKRSCESQRIMTGRSDATQRPGPLQGSMQEPICSTLYGPAAPDRVWSMVLVSSFWEKGLPT